jgi:energy-converting hydrogenase A subunit R
LGRKFFVSDCEGPISTNDNAFELAGHFIENGEKFFEIVSKYDDILADVVKRPGYTAGGTLKLIVPFLKAYGATNQNIKKFSAENVLLVPGAGDTLHFVNSIMPSFIISTSYEHYILALCNLTNFPPENAYYTKLNLESQPLNPEERKRLWDLRGKIIENPEFENLDKIFWEDVYSLKIGSIMDEVNPIGGEGKKEAIQDIMDRFKFKASDMMYVGDSITDVQSLRFASEEGGLAVSFNGNQYAVEEAEIAITADNTSMISLIADMFNRSGRDMVIEFITSYADDPESSVQNYPLNPDLAVKIQDRGFSVVEIITSKNKEKLKKESLKLRKMVRGEVVGRLG